MSIDLEKLTAEDYTNGLKQELNNRGINLPADAISTAGADMHQSVTAALQEQGRGR